MGEYYFDTHHGNLYAASGAAALKPFDMAAGRRGPQLRAGEQALVQPHLVPLLELVDAPALPEDIGPYQALDVRLWEKRHYVRYGKWVLDLLNSPAPQTEPAGARTVNTRHIRNLYRLGISPSISRIERHFETLAGFKHSIGAPMPYDRVTYASWETGDYLAYAQRLEAKLGHPPTHLDYQAAAARGEGPNYKRIHRYMHGVGELHELLGRPHIKQWQREDFITWGVQVMRQNPALPFTRELPDILCTRKNAPSMRTIVTKFDRWNTFKEAVIEEYERQEAIRQAKIDSYRALITNGDLPEEYGGLPDDELLIVGGKYHVIRRCLPHAGTERVAHILSDSENSFTSTLRKASNHTPGYIESEAWVAGVYEDIWPPDDNNQFRVSAEEFEATRLARNSYERSRRERQLRRQAPHQI